MTVQFKFSRNPYILPSKSKRGKVREIQGEVVANILDSSGAVLASGISRCSTLDNFNKNKGRKYALEDAFKNAPQIDKAQRTQIWLELAEKGLIQ